MQYRRLDSAGDFTLGSGDDFLKDSPDAVAQAIRTRLQLWKGEWFVDTSDGTPYMQDILGKRFQRSNPDSAIKARILGTPGVTEITDYNSAFNGDTRTFSITATINTSFGAVTISETL